ncbi:MAG: phosphonate ABC transporter ATP-binding protein [Rhodospirillales bacterium]|nr:phosphonate ABC transporter ATP-binding protein [Rhodospirillales bacterium]
MFDNNVLVGDNLAKPAGGASLAPPVARPDSLCQVTNLCKSFPSAGIVLDNVKLDLTRHQSVALVGANGAGKSTLLRSLVRLIEPDAGDIHLLDTPVMNLGASKLRKLRSRIGFVFQKHNLVPRLSVLSNVIHGSQARIQGPRAWYQGLATSQVRADAMTCLERVGLAHLASRRADQLSGGQSQRVAIARTLMQRPELVLADEPVASLDPKAGTEVMSLFTEIMRQEKVTLVFSTHSLDHALAYAERVVGMKGGGIVFDKRSRQTDKTDIQTIYETQ